MKSCITLCGLSLSVYNVPDEHIIEQREVTFDIDKIMQGAYIHILVQYLCKDQLGSQMFRVAFGQLSLTEEAIFGLGCEFEIEV